MHFLKRLALLLSLVLGFGFLPVTVAQASVDSSISGTLSVGSTLTVTPVGWDSTPAIQWVRNELVIPGETGSSYVLTDADFGASIKARLVGTRSGADSVETVLSQGLVQDGTYQPTYAESFVSDVQTAANITCALIPDGTVQCVGSNAWGARGDGTDRFTSSLVFPTKVSGISNAVQISMDGSTACALLSDGTAKCWGYNYYGYLGDGTRESSNTPVTVSGLANAVQIQVGSDVCALIKDGSVECWGYREGPQETIISTPKVVDGIANAVAISDDSCALIADGSVKCYSNHTSINTVTGIANATSISGSCAVQTDSKVYCWPAFEYVASEKSGLSDVEFVADGMSCAVRNDDKVFCWGIPAMVEENVANTPTPIEIPQLQGAVRISSGSNQSCAVFADQSLKCWGQNSYRQLGDWTTTLSKVPVAAIGFGLQWQPSATVTIDGTVKVGETVTVSAGSWPQGTSVYYLWNVFNREPRTSSSLELISDLAGAQLQVDVYATKPGHALVLAGSSAQSAAVSGLFIEVTGTPQLTATWGVYWPESTTTAVIGQTLNIDSSGCQYEATNAYRWFRDDVLIENATAKQYVTQEADYLHSLKAEVTCSMQGRPDVVQNSNVIGPVLKIIPFVAVPVVEKASSSQAVGTTLKASVNRVAGYNYAFQWKDEQLNDIPGATSQNWRATNAYAGQQVRVAVIISKTGYLTAEYHAEYGVYVIGGTQVGTTKPTITGDLGIGSTLTANVSGWQGSPSFTYKWYRDKSNKVIGTQQTYEVTAADAGHKLKVTVTGVRWGFRNASQTSLQTAVPLDTIDVFSTPTISGELKGGATLTANPGTWQNGVRFTYQWFKNGVAIKRATKATFKVPAGFVGSSIAAKVTATAKGYVALSKTSESAIIN